MPTVRDVLAKKGPSVQTIAPDQTVLEAARRMNESRIGALCVVDESGKLVGMFTERDILNRIVAQRRDPETVRVAEVMSQPVVTCVPNAKIADCMLAMSSQKIRHLPVVDTANNGALVGLISTGDVVAMDVAQKQEHIEHLHDYLHGRI